MKSKYLCWILLGLLVLFAAVSCKSTPPETTTPAEEAPAQPQPTPPPPAPLDRSALDAAAARAEAARKLVSDFDGPSLFPSDWQAADALYTQAEQQRRATTSQEIQESAARYNRAADAFDAMRDKTLARFYENKERELTNARNAAVSAGALALVPDYLLEADNTVANAQGKYQAKDYYAAKDAANEALTMYAALEAGLKAYKIREEIAAGVEAVVPEVLLQTDTVGMDAIWKWEAGDYNGAKAGADKALSMYAALQPALEAYTVRERIAERAWTLAPELLSQADDVGLRAIGKWEAEDYTGGKADAEMAHIMYVRTAANTERQEAVNVRANVAVRQDFNAAQTVFNQANTAYQARRFEEAGRLYNQSETRFRELTRVALERRRVAEDALRRANQRTAESNETAREAERILEGGVQ